MPHLTDAKLQSLHLACTRHEYCDFTQLLGQPLVLFFYPRDNTPGCTQSVQDFRDFYPSFQQLGINIYGVSRDTLKSHLRFSDKHQLPYGLIADPEENLCQLFDVMKEKSMFGKRVRGIVRSTFLFNAQGELVHEWIKVKIPGHTEEVLAHAKALVAAT